MNPHLQETVFQRPSMIWQWEHLRCLPVWKKDWNRWMRMQTLLHSVRSSIHLHSVLQKLICLSVAETLTICSSVIPCLMTSSADISLTILSAIHHSVFHGNVRKKRSQRNLRKAQPEDLHQDCQQKVMDSFCSCWTVLRSWKMMVRWQLSRTVHLYSTVTLVPVLLRFVDI